MGENADIGEMIKELPGPWDLSLVDPISLTLESKHT